MQDFARLFQQLDRTTATNEKVELLKSYFLSAPDEDKIWALALFSGRRPSRPVRTRDIQEWAMEQAMIPGWLFAECYHSVGDLAETISLILPVHPSTSSRSLHQWFVYLDEVSRASDELKKEMILVAWKQFNPFETFVFNKLLMGSFRIGVSQTLVIRAIAETAKAEPSVIQHRVMGEWNPWTTSYDELIYSENISDEISKPYPFYLAYALENPLESLGTPDEWMAEWKWDGIRSQIIWRKNQLYIWSRGEDLVTEKFPELVASAQKLPDGTVLDGEIVCYRDGRPLPFNLLQTRIGRKNITKKILLDAPVAFIGYDVLEFEGNDVRNLSLQERRTILEKIIIPELASFSISPVVKYKKWDELEELKLLSRENAAEGFMIKRKSAPYLSGRKKGDWWKWKIDPMTVDAVMVYAQKGHGRRAELYTDYTFAVWNEKQELVPFAKAYSGLTDAEIREVDRFVKQHTLEKFGPVRTVQPLLVFEIGFEGISKSSRHKSGIAVRFPRIINWRKDKPAEEADTLENLHAMLQLYGA